MFRERVSSWNLRDRHTADSLDALTGHLEAHAVGPPKIGVWAHNSHIGDARATESRRLAEWNVGQLARERHADEVRPVSFSTYDGSVTAASRWDGPAEHKRGSHYFDACLPDQSDAVIHIDRTTAVVPMETMCRPGFEVPETIPAGI